MIKNIKRAMAVALVGITLGLTGASGAAAWSPGDVTFTECKSKVGYQKNFLCGSYGYTWIVGPVPGHNANLTCYGATAYYYKRNSFTNPFDADQYGWYGFCTQV